MKSIRVLLILSFCSMISLVHAQSVTVKGQVLDESDNSSLPGVSVLLKGSSTGTVTDLDGNYSIAVDVSQKPVLVFSFIGFQKQEISVGSKKVVDVRMSVDATELNEVIVTAMNITQNKRDLNYAAQDIKSKEITESQQQNLVNGMQGKIAGVQVTASSGSPGASSSIVIRGGTSISEGRSNEPLFVIDGIIMDNSTFEGSGNAAMDINPDDIASMTVLKGPSAAALYGIGAGNGAVIITTKTGQAGKIQVTFGSTVALDRKFKTHEAQTTYSRGLSGVVDDETYQMWGPAYLPSDKTYNNIDEFFQTGVQQKYDLNINGGSEKAKFYMSVSNNNQTGIVPGESYNRFNFLLKGSSQLRHNLNVTASVNSIWSENVRGGSGSMYNVFNWPSDDQMSDYLNADGSKKWLIPADNPTDLTLRNRENPYWYVNNNLPEYDVNRTISQVFFDWDIIKPLKLTYRVGMDRSGQYYKNPTVPESTSSYYGRIYESDLSKERFTSTLNLSFSKMFNETWDVYVLGGANVDMTEARKLSYTGSNFLLPNLISINNTDPEAFLLPVQGTTRRRVLGTYGEVRVDYKGIASLGVTGRNDWTSTIAPGSNSFFYPSVTAGFVFTEALGGILDPVLSFGKFRASWSESGQDANAESLDVVLEQYPGPGGGYKHDYYAGNPYLRPESLKALELGVNLAFFKGRVNLDVAYYDQGSYDMIIQNRISTASGWVIQTFNTGDMSNKGWEVILDANVLNNNGLRWDVKGNFSRNRSKLSNLPGYISRLPVTTGQIINEAKPIALIGQPLYAIEGIPFLRNQDGDIVMDDNGYPRWGTYETDENGDYTYDSDGNINVSQENVFLGNREPDWLLGITNTFSYKRFGLSFLFDIKKGGDVINVTASSMMSNGTHAMIDEYRNIPYLFSGVVETPEGFVANEEEVVLDDYYFRNVHRRVGENFVEDGSWVKLRYVALSYDMGAIAERIKMQKLSFSVTGRNLFMWTKYSGGDPENDYSGSSVGGAGTIGVDYYNVPTTQGITFSLKGTF
ncbi:MULTISPECIES: SusC/RagA family TonB-linked outer membrane protein [Reichenbachiella]|uniref:SusC/RagA family TonB-linked outer membrane protein n=1 Tax=Reichenbachiella TaxID=156993 RepID=UPI001314FDB9|nr:MULTISPECIES: SusC/RagA family TonB-linked outer membrane protein [Reichenbachiella]MBU2914213.1 SusC/RagA family TonB-linked outer membrane protein [Reichenbachiella agariperforans]